MAISLGSMFVRIGATTGGLKTGLMSASGMIGKFGGIAKGAMMTAAGAVAAVGVVAGVMAVKSVKAFADVEEGYAKVNTLLDEGQDSQKIFAKFVAETNVAMGNQGDQLDVLDGLYQTISAGITDTTEAQEFMEAATIAAVGGSAKLSDVILAGTKTMAAFGEKAGSAMDVMDSFAATVKAGQLTMGELATAFPKVAGVAADMGLSLDETLGIVAGLTKVMGDADAATTGFSAIMTKILQPTEAMKTAVKSLGYDSALAMIQEEGLMKSLELLNEAVFKDTAAMAELFGNVRAVRAVLPALGAASEAVATSIESQGDKAGLAKKQLGDMASTTKFSLGELTSAMQNMMVTIGEAIMPAIQPLVDMFAEFLPTAMEKIQPIILQVVDVLSELMVAVAPLIPPLLEIASMFLDTAVVIIKAFIPAISVVVEWLKLLVDPLKVVLGWVKDLFEWIEKLVEAWAEFSSSGVAKAGEWLSNKLGGGGAPVPTSETSPALAGLPSGAVPGSVINQTNEIIIQGREKSSEEIGREAKMSIIEMGG